MTGADRRAVVSDDGIMINLAWYSGADVIAAVDLDPLWALGLASELIGAAQRHLGRAAKPRCRRGGDANAACRRERDAAACALAQLLAPGEPFEKQARLVIDRVLRYQPAVGETGTDRLLMGQIRATGLPLPSVDRVARILSASSGIALGVKENLVQPR
jgi:hypothetical protein